MPDKSCYFCGALATSDEHVPPRAIFPEIKDSPDGRDYRKQLISVPSCHAHNSANSKDDEYLLYVTTMQLSANSLGTHHFLTKVRRAIDLRPTLITRLIADVERVLVKDAETGEDFYTYAFSVNSKRLEALFERIVRGLYFYEESRRFNGSVIVTTEAEVSFEDLESNRDREFIRQAADRLFRDATHKGANPEAFSYQRITGPDGEILYRLHFYGSVRVTAMLAS